MDWKLIEVAEVLDDRVDAYGRADRVAVKGWKAAAAEQVGEQAGDARGVIRFDRRVWYWRWSAAGQAERRKRARAELVKGIAAAGDDAEEWLRGEAGEAAAEAAGYRGMAPRAVVGLLTGRAAAVA